jgi:uncharacterized membrane protein YoaK (UPF0700 family)
MRCPLAFFAGVPQLSSVSIWWNVRRRGSNSRACSARLTDLYKALFGAGSTLSQDGMHQVTWLRISAELNGTNCMSTDVVTTQVDTVHQQATYVRSRNQLLAALTISSGTVDVISFFALGKIFTAFMTGNIVFLGMGLAGHPGAPRIVPVLASMAGFAGGVYVATKIVKPSRQTPARGGEQLAAAVWPPRTTVALGVSLLAHLCFLAIWFVTNGQPDDNVIPVLLAVWALAMGNQSAAVRQLNVGGVFTTAATATLIFLVGDWANNRPLTSEEHNRLRGVLVSLVLGAVAGAFLVIHAPKYAPAFPFVITIGVVAIAATVFRDRGNARPRLPQYAPPPSKIDPLWMRD